MKKRKSSKRKSSKRKSSKRKRKSSKRKRKSSKRKSSKRKRKSSKRKRKSSNSSNDQKDMKKFIQIVQRRRWDLNETGSGLTHLRFFIPLKQFNRLFGVNATEKDIEEDDSIVGSLFVQRGRFLISYGADSKKKVIDPNRNPDFALIYRVLKNHPNIDDYPDYDLPDDDNEPEWITKINGVVQP